MSKIDLNSKDVLMLMLFAPTEKPDHKDIIGRTRVIKLMYIFQKEIFTKFKNDHTSLKEAKFEPWNFGPWSKDVYEDIEFLANLRFISVDDSNEEPAYGEAEEDELWESAMDVFDEAIDEFSQEKFTLSSMGTDFIKRKWDQLSDNQREVLITFKEKFNAVPLYALLKYVYTKYPESTTKSKIKDKVLGV